MADDQDIPLLDDTVAKLPKDIRDDLAARLAGDLFAFGRVVCGYRDLTKRAHGPMCVFLDRNPAQVRACGMPRDTFKTSLGTIASTMREIPQNPNNTHLINNESQTNSSRFLRAIRLHAETNRVYRTLYSSIIPKDTRKVRWNDQELDFNREDIRPEPTIDTIGMTGAATSRHFDRIVFDDIISEEAAKSDKVMKDTTDRARKFRALFRKPEESRLDIMFTHWSYADTYSVLFKEVKGIAKMIRGAIEDDGPIFPEHLSLATLSKLRAELGEYAFSCLYMNAPRNSEVQDFNIQDLRFFEIREAKGEVPYVVLLDATGNEVRRYRLSQLMFYATVDLAAAEKTSSDRNAVTVCGLTPTNEVLVFESWARRCTPLQLMEFIFYCQRRWAPSVWGIEDVAYQKAFKYFLADYADREDLYFNIKPIAAIKAKETRIRGLQPIAATHRLYLLADQHILRNELAAFPLGEHDDAADSLSMQLQLWQGQMSPRRWSRYLEAERLTIHAIENQHLALAGMPPRDDNDGLEIDLIPTSYESFELGRI